MKLGDILVEEGHLSQEGLQEALDWQVLYGGRLGTNLLELKLVEEEQLARALGRQLGVEVAWGDLQVDPEMLGLIPRHIADRNEIVPWKIEKRRLKVLCSEADKLELIDELSIRTGKVCQVVVAPEFRMFQLLRKHYQATRQMRALDFGVVPVEREALRRKKEKEKRGGLEEAPELIDESAFAAIYAQVLEGRSVGDSSGQQAQPAATVIDGDAPEGEAASEPPPAPPPQKQQPPAKVAPVRVTALKPAPPAAKARPQPPPSVAEPRETPTLVHAKPVPKRIYPKPPSEPVIEPLPDDAILGEIESAAPEAPPAEDVDVVEEMPAEQGAWSMHPPEATPPRERTAASAAWDEPAPEPEKPADAAPLDFNEAVALLEGVTDRAAIAHIVLRAARSKAARALLLQVQGNVALGWDGLGEGLENGAARAVAVPLTLPSAFELVVKSRSHFLGPLQKTPINIRFLAQTGKKVPLSSLILPILHRERVTFVLYLDNGHRQQAPTDIGEMLILSQRIARSVEALVERKRQAARA